MSEGAVPAPVLVIGDVMTDVIVRPEGPLRRGSDQTAAVRSRPGGSGANQAVWLAALGGDVRFVARVGAADKPGLVTYFRGFGVKPLLSADMEHPSGVLVTIVDADGERSFLTDRGANLKLCAADLPDMLLDGIGLVVVSGYSFFAEGPRLAVRALLERARSRGLPVAVDPASVGFLQDVGVDNFLAWTSGAALLFANEDEAAVLSGYGDVDSQMVRLGTVYERVVIKRGAMGAAIGSLEGVRLSLPAPQVPVLDSTGAGDAFAAGFILAHLGGETEHACLAAGIAAGAEAVKVIGGQPAPGRK
ncbi:MAG TPA: PfkB family carbohydrate kinase [Devosiaceae bacterium]|jgi:sugar/nucleoside kinase (ribokinase family)